MDGLTFALDRFVVMVCNLSCANGWIIVGGYETKGGIYVDIEHPQTDERVNGLPIELLLTEPRGGGIL